MISPQNSPPVPLCLEGASHTSGGILHGKAFGNVFNHADAPDTFETSLGPVKGKVFVYLSHTNPSNFDFKLSKPSCHFQHPVTPTIGPILKVMGRQFSPVSKYDHHVFVCDGDSWDLKGRYELAVEDDEDIEWEGMMNGNPKITFLVVSVFFSTNNSKYSKVLC
ncbi:hypothetical protein BYT27DRAFT_7117155 [Phlegmacium glaucopus]|nr:hypothetical protein BYT27DRAFT_7117155 [Phlegmacium glaucopus]